MGGARKERVARTFAGEETRPKTREVSMRIKLFGAITLACSLLGGAAMACPVGENVPPPRPRPVQNVSLRVSELIEQATRFESAAAQKDRNAMALEQEAESLAARARNIRNEAQFVSVSTRGDLIAVADELAMRAQNDRSRAANERMTASEFRTQARSFRAQAAALQGNGGGGWRKGPVRDFAPGTSTPSAPSQATTDI